MANVRALGLIALMLVSGCGLSTPASRSTQGLTSQARVSSASTKGAIPKTAKRMKFASAWMTASPSWLQPGQHSMLTLNVMADANKQVMSVNADWSCAGGMLDSYYTFGGGMNGWTAPQQAGADNISAWVTVRYSDNTSDTAYVNTMVTVSQ